MLPKETRNDPKGQVTIIAWPVDAMHILSPTAYSWYLGYECHRHSLRSESLLNSIHVDDKAESIFTGKNKN
jgi:hypothetical protein